MSTARKWFKKQWAKDSVGLLSLGVATIGAIMIPIFLWTIQHALTQKQQETHINLACTINDKTPTTVAFDTIYIAAQCYIDNVSKRKITVSNIDSVLFYDDVAFEAFGGGNPNNEDVDYTSTDTDFDIKTRLPYTLDQSEEVRFKALVHVPMLLNMDQMKRVDACTDAYEQLSAVNSCVMKITKKLIPNFVYDPSNGFNAVGIRVTTTDGTVEEQKVGFDGVPYVDNENVPELSTHHIDKSCWVFGLSEQEKRSQSADFTTICGTGAKVRTVATLSLIALVYVLTATKMVLVIRHRRRLKAEK